MDKDGRAHGSPGDRPEQPAALCGPRGEQWAPPSHSLEAHRRYPVAAVSGRGGCAWPQCCSQVSHIENEPFLKKVFTPRSSPASPPPPSLPKPSCLPHPSQHPVSPPPITPPPPPVTPPPCTALCPALTPLPGPSLRLTLCPALPLAPAQSSLELNWGKGQADRERREWQSCPHSPPHHKTNMCLFPAAAGPGLPSLCSAPCLLLSPPGPGAHWVIGESQPARMRGARAQLSPAWQSPQWSLYAPACWPPAPGDAGHPLR